MRRRSGEDRRDARYGDTGCEMRVVRKKSDRPQRGDRFGIRDAREEFQVSVFRKNAR